jgi:hypothetical protein
MRQHARDLDGLVRKQRELFDGAPRGQGELGGSGELADDDAPDEPAPKFERADERLAATEVLEPVEPGPAVPGHELGHPGRRAAGELEQDQLAARVAALE